MIAQAKARGLDVDCDCYPYAAGSNPLKNLLPQWVQAGGVDGDVGTAALAETRERIRADIARDGLNNWGRIPSWDCVQISISPNLPHYAGRTIGALAAQRGEDPIDTVADYLIDDKGATRVLVTSISEDDIREIVRRHGAGRIGRQLCCDLRHRRARACRIRASTGRFLASSAITSASSALSRLSSLFIR